MPFIPHTADDVARMLEVIGARSIDELFDEIPADLKASSLGAVPASLCEMEVARLLGDRAARDGRLLNFVGAGAYEHHLPAPVWAITTPTPRIRRRRARGRCRSSTNTRA